MDWILSVTTVACNLSLGWTKGHPAAWFATAVNAVLWIGYAIAIDQPGLIPSAVVMGCMAAGSGIVQLRKRRKVMA